MKSAQDRIEELEKALEIVAGFLNRSEMTRNSYLRGIQWPKDLAMIRYYVERTLGK